MASKILVIEDEPKIAELIGKYLALENYGYLHAGSGAKGIELFQAERPDLIILDVMLPDLNGLEVCKRIREQSEVPIIMLTARVDEIDRLLGFAKGADDYVCKPFILRELMARIKAILKRAQPYGSSAKLTHGPIEVDPGRHLVRIHGEDAQLTLIEFSLLAALVAAPDKAFTRGELLDAAHGPRSDKDSRTIDSHMKNLRRKLNALSPDKSYIRAVYGVGYKLR